MHLWWLFSLFTLTLAEHKKKSISYPDTPSEPDLPYEALPDITIYLPPYEPVPPPTVSVRPQVLPPQSVRPPIQPPQSVRPPIQPPQSVRPPIQPYQPSVIPSIQPSQPPIRPPVIPPEFDGPPIVEPHQEVFGPTEEIDVGDNFSDYPDASHDLPEGSTPSFPSEDTSPIILPHSPISPLLPTPPSIGSKQDNFNSDIYEVMPAGEMALLDAIDVMCAMNSMRIRLSFDRVFDGVIYSKGFFNDQNCHFVPWGSRQSVYEFEVTLDRCGTQFIDNMASGGSASLENILLMQNEPTIQEMWDIARRVQCTWQGKMDHSVASGFQVDMLDTISVAYSGDDVSAEMNVLIGRGPIGQSAQGLLRIGEQLSVVISVFGSGDMDVLIHDCIAHDGDRNNGLQLSDSNGCIIKKKLMGAWQFTRETGNSGASLIAYANLKAFRFPDKTDVYLECGLEICKGQCPNFCPEYPTIDFRSLKSKRSVDGDSRDATLVKAFKVIDESVENNSSVLLMKRNYQQSGEICVSILGFSLGITVFIVLLAFTSVTTIFVSIRTRKRNAYPSVYKNNQRHF